MSDLDEKVADERGGVARHGAHRLPSAGPNRILVVLGVAAVFAAAAAVLTLLWPDAAQSDEAPRRPIPPSMMMPTGTPTSATPQPSTPPPSPTPTVVTTPVEAETEAPAPASTPVQPQPTQQPTARSTESAPPAVLTPTTRAPISVQPEPRPAFPNQHPPTGGGNADQGGLLGRGGLL